MSNRCGRTEPDHTAAIGERRAEDGEPTRQGFPYGRTVTRSPVVRAQNIKIPGWARPIVDVLHATYIGWRDARTKRIGAGIAYYALFALVPLVSLSIWLAELLVPDQAVSDFFEQLAVGLNIEGEATAGFIDEIGRTSTQTGLGLIGFGSLLFAAAVVVSALQDAFDEIWELPVARGIWNKVRRRLKAFLIVGGGGIVIVLTLVINAVSGLLKRLLPGESSVLDRIPDLFSFVSGWVLLIGGLAIVFQVLTRERINVIAVGIGSSITAALLAIGTQLLNWYLTRFGSTSLSGALSSVFLVLAWLYFVAQVILIGGHLILVLDKRRTSPKQRGSRP